mgnify:CR=1 FL=1
MNKSQLQKVENKSFDQCIKCTVCTIYCPVARVSPLYPGPKQSGPDTERLRIKNPELVDDSLQYCNNCKRCEIACPSNVPITDLINKAKYTYLKNINLRIRDYILSSTDLVGQFSIKINRIVNFFLARPLIKFFLDFFWGITYKRAMPRYEKETFLSWYKKSKKKAVYKKSVIYFHGCYVNYNDHQLGRELIEIFNVFNIGVMLIKEKCCGVPLIANGYIKKAKKHARYNIRKLSKYNKLYNSKIVITSSSCSYAIKHEYPTFLGVDNSEIWDSIEFVTKSISDYLDSTESVIKKMKPLNIRVAYHAPCHLERMGGVVYTINVLKKIPGLELIILHSECCGIAGTYGYKKEYYTISQQIGDALFKRIEQVSPEYVVTDCETCKMQIEMNTTYKVLHPVNLLAMSLL